MKRRIPILLALVLLAAGCAEENLGPDPLAQEAERLRTDYDLARFLRPERPAYPPDNPPLQARVDLGRLLYFDPILSGDMDVSCGHCHHPAFAWADGRALGAGVTGTGLGPERTLGDPSVGETPRNSPAVLDAAFNGSHDPEAPPWLGSMFWEGRVQGLESQARRPIRSRDEMAHDAYPASMALPTVLARLQSIPDYVDRFVAAFPREAGALPPDRRREVISSDTYARAVAAYEREVYSAGAPFDRFVQGEDAALDAAQRRGLELFFAVGCDDCHHGPMFSDFDFHALGVKQAGPGKPPIHERGDGSDRGRFLVEPLPENDYAFRTPTLRNLPLTAPYFHTGGKDYPQGAYETLEGAIRFFDRGCNDEGLPAEVLEPMAPLGLSPEQVADLAAFLRSLTATRLGSPLLDPTVPERVPSGLSPPEALEPVLR